VGRDPAGGKEAWVTQRSAGPARYRLQQLESIGLMDFDGYEPMDPDSSQGTRHSLAPVGGS
jgi:hypothetical protein